MRILIVGVGGFLGSMARYAVYLLLPATQTGFPLATLVINSVGSALLGAALAIITTESLPASSFYLFFGVGFLGAFTTFSTFSMETISLLRDGLLRLAVLNIFLSLALGLGGYALARYIFSRS